MSITAHGGGLVSGLAGCSNKFTVFTSGKNVSGLTVAFEGPSKPSINFSNNKDGSVDVSYTPLAGGAYKIHVKYDNRDIIGSPFKCNVTGDDSAHKKLVSKVKISGPNMTAGKANQNNEVLIDCKESGITGGINFAMEGPSKPEVNFVNNKDMTITVQFKPTLPGDYKLHLMFNNIHLPGSPFPITIT